MTIDNSDKKTDVKSTQNLKTMTITGNNGGVINTGFKTAGSAFKAVVSGKGNSSGKKEFSLGNGTSITIGHQGVAKVNDALILAVQNGLANYATSLAKSSKYKKLSENFDTLRQRVIDKGTERINDTRRTSTVLGGIGNFFSGIGDAVEGVAGGVLGFLGNAVSFGGTWLESGIDTSYQTKAKEYEQISERFLDYGEYLTNRDEILTSAMNTLTNSMSEMRGTYGDAFVSQFYNLMLAKNGLTPDSYSMLTGGMDNMGNFRTFEAGMYGEASEENGLFDSLTSGNQDLFDGLYAKLTSQDLGGIKDSLTRALFAGDTEFGETLRGYENDLSALLDSYIGNQESLLADTQESLESLGAQARSEEISYAEEIGEAEAKRATSGLRGGTAYANESLAKLSRDLGRLSRMASATNVIGNLRRQMKQLQLNATSTAYNYRTAMKKANMSARNAMIAWANGAIVTTDEAQRRANAYRSEAETTEEDIRNKMKNMDATDADIVLDGLYQ